VKYYDFGLAPNPRRVRLFMLEKGLHPPTVEINLRAGEQFSDAFKRVNPRLMVPCLELDDGTIIDETLAICRYLEAVQPAPCLFGATALDIARVEQWNRRAEIEGFLPAADALRNSEARFANRAVPGPRDFAQIPALVERGKMRAAAFFADLDAHMAGREFVATASFSAADITAYVTVEFAARVGVVVQPEQTALARWFAATQARPSVRALPAPP
jgi:glutathione S-transferase